MDPRTRANLESMVKGFEAGYRAASGLGPQSLLVLRESDKYYHSLVFDDSQPCTCGGHEDGLHGSSCAKRRL